MLVRVPIRQFANLIQNIVLFPFRILEFILDQIPLDVDDRILAFIMISPAMALIFLFAIYPALKGLWTGFYLVDSATLKQTYVGLDNYTDLFKDSLFWESLKRTLILVSVSNVVQLALGLMISLLVHQELVGRNLVRGIVLFPYLVPAIVIALTWRFALDPTLGIVNKSLLQNGLIDRPIPFFARINTAFPMVIFAGIWKYTPFFVIMLLARLQVIPVEIQEAARLDGANEFQLFRHITLPWLMPVIIIALLLRTIWTFNEFEMVYLFAFGGPLFSTTTLPVLVQHFAFGADAIGRASATATVMVIILLAMSWVYFRVYGWSEEQLY